MTVTATPLSTRKIARPSAAKAAPVKEAPGGSFAKRLATSTVAPRMSISDICGLKEISEAFDVEPTTVHNWLVRYSDFPKPVATLGSRTRIWDLSSVKAWHEARLGSKADRPAPAKYAAKAVKKTAPKKSAPVKKAAVINGKPVKTTAPVKKVAAKASAKKATTAKVAAKKAPAKK